MTASSQPNVILIIMDDLAYGDLACHGNPYTHTPNLDAFHAHSTHMTRYCSGPLCTPARASLMTGRYHLRTRAIDTYLGRAMIDPDEVTLPRMFAAAGYRTGIFGKWHLGDCYPNRPIDMGFETALVHRSGGIAQPGDHPDNYGRESYFDPVLNHNGHDEQHSGYCTDIFAEGAMSFIEQHRDAPFFTYLATNAPHTPLQIADEWVERYRQLGINEAHARIYGMVENIDWNIGRLLNKLDELGLRENTIVIYTSDHGPCRSADNKDAPAEKRIRFNAGLRDAKGSLYEGGIRVPHFWMWPGHFAAEHDIDRIASPIDVAPTLAALCGLQLPDDRTIDGVDLSPLLTGQQEPQDWPARSIFMQWHRGDVPVAHRNSATITQQYKLYRPTDDVPDELYDIINDPSETTDLAADKPELVASLRQQYLDWFADVSSTRPDNYAPPRIYIGTAHENPTLLTRNDWRIHGEDGWGDEHYGHWEVKAPEDATYQITLRFSHALTDQPVFLKIDDVVREQVLAAGQDCIFEGVPIESGLHQIEGWSTNPDGSRLSVLYVTVSRH